VSGEGFYEETLETRKEENNFYLLEERLFSSFDKNSTFRTSGTVLSLFLEKNELTYDTVHLTYLRAVFQKAPTTLGSWFRDI